ncbi:hypothetical protein AB0E63_23220 [Kribbella sp. NPDC026596]|uniref:hypothetical protein n=1 Tax=Kribbella sp. NPDC026596 TaxID=3155122 RepID=UPI0033EE81DC
MTMNDDRRFEATDDDRMMTDTDRASDALGDRTDYARDDRTSDALGDRADYARDDRTTDEPTSERASEEPLVAPDAVVDFRARWEVIQQGFVDDPRQAVTEADNLVDDLLKRLSDTFESQHQDLEKQWSDGAPSTEDLRSALQRYRAFFQRLLTL